MTDQSWRKRAACKDHPAPDWWFPKPTDTIARKAAETVCAACTVRFECRAEARRTGSEGIWGGRTFYRPYNEPKPTSEPNDPRCGTSAGYMAHRRRNEPACTPCRDANTEATRERDTRSGRGHSHR